MGQFEKNNGRKRFLPLITLSVSLLMAACGGKSTKSADVVPVEKSDTVVAPVESELTGSDIVFDETKLRTYNLTIAPEDWDFLQNNITKEQYVPATLDVDGDTVGQVGLRYKGSTFTLEGCAGVREGERCHKISMKIKFNQFDKALRFHGLKRLNFNSMMYDKSALRERLAYSIFREMGVKTSRATHARIVINGEYRGLFSLVEQIDKQFVQKNFPENQEGNLYKERWPLTADTAYYKRGLKTNKLTATNGEFVNFFNALDSSADSALPAEILKRTNIDYLMDYMAVDRAISNWDGVTGFYPSKEIEGLYVSHNFYWYQEKNREFFWLLPWDLDGSMTLRTGFDHVPEWNEKVDDCETTYDIFGGETKAVAPTCDKFMNGLAQLSKEDDRYHKAMVKLLEGPFKEGYLESKMEEWAKQIELSVAEDLFGPAKPVWENAMGNLYQEIRFLRKRLENRVNGLETVPFSWTIAGDGFENVDDYQFHLGSKYYCNLKSGVKVRLNRNSPIDGKQDLRIDFKMYNEVENPEEGAYSQWTWTGSNFKDDEEQNFLEKNIVGIRLTAFADEYRDMWISVGSNAYRRDEGGIYFGWYAELSTEPKVIELYFKDGQFPVWMSAPEDGFEVDEITKYVTSMNFSPVAAGREEGMLKTGEYDEGFVQFDNLQFIVKEQ